MVNLSDFHIQFMVDLLRIKENETESFLEDLEKDHPNHLLKEILVDTKFTCEELCSILTDSLRGKL